MAKIRGQALVVMVFRAAGPAKPVKAAHGPHAQVRMAEHRVDGVVAVVVRHREDLPGGGEPVPDPRVHCGGGDARLIDSGEQAASQRPLGLGELRDRAGAAHAPGELGERVVTDRVAYAPRNMRKSLTEMTYELKKVGTVNGWVIET